MDALTKTFRNSDSVVLALNGQIPGSQANLVEMVDKINELVNAGPTSETVTTGALSLTVHQTNLSVTGTKAYTLAAPTYAGQRKRIVCTVAATSPAGTLTLTDPDDTTGSVCATKFFFDNVGQTLELEATAGLKWRATRITRTGHKTLVVGTTVTTDICNMSHINLSVTGTVASATTKGIPNGSAPGEILLVGCSTATGTPHGDITGAFTTTLGTAANTLDDFTATTDHLMFVWTGTTWQLLSNNSTAVTLTQV